MASDYSAPIFAMLLRRAEHSNLAFGPDFRWRGILDHLRKELAEVELAEGTDLEEWIDIILLGLDGATRCALVQLDNPKSVSSHIRSTTDVLRALEAKIEKNAARKWPDWRTADPNKAIEHDRSADGGAS